MKDVVTMPQAGSEEAASQAGADVRVWDILVRVAHWVMVASFFVAYFTEGEVLTLHVWAGYVLGTVLCLRIVWGFVGTKHARFVDFVFPPAMVVRYFIRLLTFRAKRYLGHSPAGGAMVIALMFTLLLTTGSGLVLYAVEENAGPLAGVVAHSSQGQARSPLLLREARADEDDTFEYRHREGDEDELWEEVHEVLANLTLFLVILHVIGVILASAVHRENLVRAMLTGRKRPNAL